MPSPSPSARRLRLNLSRLLPFWWWLVWFYSAWLALVLLGELWPTVLQHWPIAAAMAAGSYVAGSTPMGGGTVGFPVLVLLFDGPAALGRGFSYCIQSIGMTSAGLFLLSSRAPIGGRLLLWTMLGMTVSIPLTLRHIAPLASDLTVKLLFACLWAAFGLATLVRLRQLLRAHHMPHLSHGWDMALGTTAGVLGGVATGLTGVGVDMMLYMVMVLLYRCDLRAAIGTSVLAMAYGSMVGVVASAGGGQLDRVVFDHWVAAAPVVAIGAPIGVLMMRIIPRTLTLVLVSCLCVLQLIWTCIDQQLSAPMWGLAIAAVLAANLLFHVLYRCGKRLVPERPVTAEEAEPHAAEAIS